MSPRSEYAQYPFLTPSEFELACAFFDQRYIQAKLGPTRQIFKIRLRRALTTGESYIEILRLLDLKDGDDGVGDELVAAIGRLGGGGGEMEMRDEDEDMEVLRPNGEREGGGESDGLPRYSLYSHQPYVMYEIHLHTAYQVPTLWFTLHDLPNGERGFDLDAVYRYLVPPEYKSRMREVGVVGVVGGISAAPHPITDVPAFFIHPCQTKEAMEGLECDIKNYLMAWIGLVGGCVGLWVPSEMAKEDMEN